VDDLIERALAEDVGAGDLTTNAVVPADARARAEIVQKEPGVIVGLAVAEAVFRRIDPALAFTARIADGERREGGLVAEVSGPARGILTGERVALNFVQRLSGIATLTARFVEAVEGTGAVILDTRKTTPGMRELEKAAVAAGGGRNHRHGLFDAILIKENHIALAGGVGEAVRRALAEGVPVEVECATLDEVEEALTASATHLLLDNMSPAELREAVARAAGRAKLEASGGVTLETVREIAETGVDYISVGALTHSAPALDLSLVLHAA
jgi:nicotinate-nucleotide pyrophosphorylase (carboxylating)